MSFATTGMGFQGIIINEIRQRKTKLGAICLTSGINKAKFIETKSRLGVARGKGLGVEEMGDDDEIV